MWIAREVRGAALAAKARKKQGRRVAGSSPAQARDARTGVGQKMIKLAEALRYKAWNPIPTRVSQCLSTGDVDSAQYARRRACSETAKKARPQRRGLASMRARGARTGVGQKMIKLAEALRHKAWNPIPTRVSRCLSTGDVDSAEQARRRARGETAKKARPQRRRFASLRARGARTGVGQKMIKLAEALRRKA